MMDPKNTVQLITYPDSLGANIQDLHTVLETYFSGLFEGGIHLLPPFPSSGDRGFAPLTYYEIDPEYGNWDDIKGISKQHDIMIDLMANHISKDSLYFRDVLKEGKKSKYYDLFIHIKDFWPSVDPQSREFAKLFRRREKPFSCYKTDTSDKTIQVWTTFGKENPSEQIDINIHSAIARRLFKDVLTFFKNQNITFVRLDAVGYVVKKIGSSCFFVEPDIFEFLSFLKNIADSLGILLLPEVHASYEIQCKLSENGFWIYDFILPFAVLHALINRSSISLRRYLLHRPRAQFTMLDCHDGVPVKPDLDGVFEPEEIRRVVDICISRGANVSKIISPEYKDKDGYNVHQIRGTYYSILQCNDDAYIAARAIQFFTPGIPQVYYVGLLAGKNFYNTREKKSDGRDINRYNYSLEEIDKAVKQKVVQRLLRLINFRNRYPAFCGDFTLKDSDDKSLRMSWKKENTLCELHIDLIDYTGTVLYVNEELEEASFII